MLADAPPPLPPAAGFRLVAARVAPALAFFGARPVRIAFRFRATAILDLRVEIVRAATGNVVRRYTLRDAIPTRVARVRWSGLTSGGRVAADGRYVVRVRPGPRRRARRLGTVTLRGHLYPIRGSHADRGGIGAFGMPRLNGRIHEGYDVNAACGVPVVAARAGRVVRSIYHAELYGFLVVVRDGRTRTNYWYAHLQPDVRVRHGQRVRTGQLLGRIGATGNARSVGCHLHFEIRPRGRPIDPAPHLHAWDRWS